MQQDVELPYHMPLLIKLTRDNRVPGDVTGIQFVCLIIWKRNKWPTSKICYVNSIFGEFYRLKISRICNHLPRPRSPTHSLLQTIMHQSAACTYDCELSSSSRNDHNRSFPAVTQLHAWELLKYFYEHTKYFWRRKRSRRFLLGCGFINWRIDVFNYLKCGDL